MTKTFKISDWEDWVSLCFQYDYNPFETADFGIDQGGGDSIGYEFVGDYPEEEEE